MDLDIVIVSDAMGGALPLVVNDGEVTVSEYYDLAIGAVGFGSTYPSTGVHSILGPTTVEIDAIPVVCYGVVCYL